MHLDNRRLRWIADLEHMWALWSRQRLILFFSLPEYCQRERFLMCLHCREGDSRWRRSLKSRSLDLCIWRIRQEIYWRHRKDQVRFLNWSVRSQRWEEQTCNYQMGKTTKRDNDEECGVLRCLPDEWVWSDDLWRSLKRSRGWREHLTSDLQHRKLFLHWSQLLHEVHWLFPVVTLPLHTAAHSFSWSTRRVKGRWWGCLIQRHSICLVHIWGPACNGNEELLVECPWRGSCDKWTTAPEFNVLEQLITFHYHFDKGEQYYNIIFKDHKYRQNGIQSQGFAKQLLQILRQLLQLSHALHLLG